MIMENEDYFLLTFMAGIIIAAFCMIGYGMWSLGTP